MALPAALSIGDFQDYFAFLVMMAPTSSILPIRDPIAERRLYFGILGLILTTAGLLSRVKMPRTSLTAALGAVLFDFRGCDALPLGGSLVERDRVVARYGGEIAGEIARTFPTGQRLFGCGPVRSGRGGICEGGAVEVRQHTALQPAGGLGARARVRQPAAASAGEATGSGIDRPDCVHVYTQTLPRCTPGRRNGLMHWRRSTRPQENRPAQYPNTYAYRGLSIRLRTGLRKR